MAAFIPKVLSFAQKKAEKVLLKLRTLIQIGLDRTRMILLILRLIVMGLSLFPGLLLAQESKSESQQGFDAIQKGDYDLALTCYNKILRVNPKDADAYCNRGIAYGAKGDNDRAIADFNEAIRLNPEFANAYDNRGIVYGAKGDNNRAIADFNEAIHLNPIHADIYYSCGNIYQAKGDFGRAITDFNEAIRLKPKLVDNYYIRRGVAYSAKGDFDRAIADFNEAIQINPNSVSGYNEFAWLMATCPEASFRDGKKAVEYATKACQLSEWKDQPSVDTLAAACAEVGDFEQAIKWEIKYLATPNLSEKDSTEAKSRVALYQVHKPYHVEKH